MSYNQRYYFTFYSDRDTRIVNGIPDEYLCSISQLDYEGEVIEIQAQQNPIQINYQNTSSNKLEAIIGSECTLNLIATEDFELEDLYTENEREFLVEIFRNGGLIWSGFIIPDGCQEAFTFAPYPISVNAVDGLGLLKNLSYVQNDGNFYLGKQSFIEVINACLIRLDAPSLVLNTCVNIYETSMTQGNSYDPLALSFVNSERYLKDDQFTPMNCEDVLRSILEEWTAVMIQSGGEWYIYRPTELALSGDLTFRKYLDGQRVYDQPTVTIDLDATLGGESEGVILSPYFHINTDQMKMIDRPYKNASMAYLYGKLENTDEKLANPNLTGAGQSCGGDPIGPCDSVTIPGYTKTGTMYAGLNPTSGNVTFRILAPSGTVNDIVYTRISAYVFLDFGDEIGEIHTATQTGKFTFVPETINVFNGDSPNVMYVGAIYQDDEVTLTERWVRRGLSESILAVPYEVNKQFLRIAVEEKQRLYAGPFVRFEGSIFGYFNPVTRWSINSITGYFMNLSLNYDLQQNICKAVLGRIVNEEIALDYVKTPDYAATTRVTVKGTP
jgi:hypothetical protein